MRKIQLSILTYIIESVHSISRDDPDVTHYKNYHNSNTVYFQDFEPSPTCSTSDFTSSRTQCKASETSSTHRTRRHQKSHNFSPSSSFSSSFFGVFYTSATEQISTLLLISIDSLWYKGGKSHLRFVLAALPFEYAATSYIAISPCTYTHIVSTTSTVRMLWIVPTRMQLRWDRDARSRRATRSARECVLPKNSKVTLC